jgi:hypothetical protein
MPTAILDSQADQHDRHRGRNVNDAILSASTLLAHEHDLSLPSRLVTHLHSRLPSHQAGERVGE